MQDGALEGHNHGRASGEGLVRTLVAAVADMMNQDDDAIPEAAA
jgi:hypothetical protein